MAITELPNDPRPPRCDHTGVDLRNGRCADCKRRYESWYVRVKRATDPDFAERRRILAATGAARRKNRARRGLRWPTQPVQQPE